MSQPLILASTSPRRRELLQQLGYVFTILPSPYTETNDPTRLPVDLVREQSLGKALAIAIAHPQALVLGADTLVVCDGQIFGKPTSPQEARIMLQQLQGRWHEVCTGMALVEGTQQAVFDQITRVCLIPLTQSEISWYVGTGEPLDKAGAYAIQGMGTAFVQEIQGCYATVVGLPVPLLYQELKKRGHQPKPN